MKNKILKRLFIINVSTLILLLFAIHQAWAEKAINPPSKVIGTLSDEIISVFNPEIIWQVNGISIASPGSMPQLASDNSGGAIIIWLGATIYAERINEFGNQVWPVSRWPFIVSASGGAKRNPQIISDGSGGAIVVWEEVQSDIDTDIYAQHVSANGEMLWTQNGIPVSAAENNQIYPQLINDDAGGVIIVWQDYRNTSADIYAQRLDQFGNPLWSLDGIPVCAAENDQTFPRFTSDGSNGALIMWVDHRNENTSGTDIYAQKIDLNGNLQWQPYDGLAICTADGDQSYSQIIHDGSGGAIIAWQDYRIGQRIYAQKVDATGQPQWQTNGVRVCNESDSQNFPEMTENNLGEAIVVWEDGRNGNSDIYAQALRGDGSLKWPQSVAISTAIDSQSIPHIVSDGLGGAIIVWNDYRNSHNYDIYIQRINADGNVQWTPNGMAICTADFDQYNPQMINDSSGGTIIVWQDYRNRLSDIYGQRVR